MFACEIPNISSCLNETCIFYTYLIKVTKIRPSWSPTDANKPLPYVLTGFRDKSLHAVAFLNSGNFGPNLTPLSSPNPSPLSTEFMRKSHFSHTRITNRHTITESVSTNLTLCVYFLTFDIYFLGLYILPIFFFRGLD